MSKMKVYTFKAPENLVEMLDREALRMGKTRSELIRYLIEQFLLTGQPLRRFKYPPIKIRRVRLT